MYFGENWPLCPATNISLPPTFHSETTMPSNQLFLFQPTSTSFGKHWPSFGQPPSYFLEDSNRCLTSHHHVFAILPFGNHAPPIGQPPSCVKSGSHFNRRTTVSFQLWWHHLHHGHHQLHQQYYIFVIFYKCGEIDNFLPMTLPTIPTLTSVQHSTICRLSSYHEISTTRLTSTFNYLLPQLYQCRQNKYFWNNFQNLLASLSSALRW